MNAVESTLATSVPVTLPIRGVRAWSIQAVLLAASAALLPALCHLAGLPVRWLLPMHWAVLLAGLTYGWRAGALIGLLAPGASFLISGMPLPHILPAMTVELATYGLVSGAARQSLRWGGHASALLSILAGRLVFVVIALLSGAARPALGTYVATALLPGVAAALAQIGLLPVIASWWVRDEQARAGR